MTIHQQARGLYAAAAVIGVVGLVLGVVILVMGHTVEGVLTIIGFLLAAGLLTAVTTWARRTDRARATTERDSEPE
jgi:predicted lipid-binding transport protein (Tim44 family)